MYLLWKNPLKMVPRITSISRALMMPLHTLRQSVMMFMISGVVSLVVL